MVAVGIWLMERASAEPAAQAVGRAPDPAEEQLAREQARARAEGRSSVLLAPGGRRIAASWCLSPGAYGFGVVFDPQRARNGITLMSQCFSLSIERVYGVSQACLLAHATPGLRRSGVAGPRRAPLGRCSFARGPLHGPRPR
jgi:hypothetical protein